MCRKLPLLTIVALQIQRTMGEGWNEKLRFRMVSERVHAEDVQRFHNMLSEDLASSTLDLQKSRHELNIAQDHVKVCYAMRLALCRLSESHICHHGFFACNQTDTQYAIC